MICLIREPGIQHGQITCDSPEEAAELAAFQIYGAGIHVMRVSSDPGQAGMFQAYREGLTGIKKVGEPFEVLCSGSWRDDGPVSQEGRTMTYGQFVILREDGTYVSQPVPNKDYTDKLQYAWIFKTVEEAKKSCAVWIGNETILQLQEAPYGH